MDKIFEKYAHCTLCPRQCGVDRRKTRGFCGESDELAISAILLHGGEEPCISAGKGSGTIFFTGCSLQCSFCQNMEISHHGYTHSHTQTYTPEGLIEAIEKLETLGAANINFVTPDHFMPHIIHAVRTLKEKGFTLPFIYNCSGYQSMEHLQEIVDYIDIFLFDYKFALRNTAEYCAHTPDYPEVASKALGYLLRKKGQLRVDENGKARQGVLVRHLVLPDFVDNSKEVTNELFINWGPEVYLSLMSQYTPGFLQSGHERINRLLKKEEYQEVIDLAEELGFTSVFIQEIDNANDPYIPDFEHKELFGDW